MTRSLILLAILTAARSAPAYAQDRDRSRTPPRIPTLQRMDPSTRVEPSGGADRNSPAWVDYTNYAVNAAEPAAGSVERTSRLMRLRLGPKNAATRSLGRKYRAVGKQLSRYGKHLAWIDRASALVSVAGRLSADAPDLAGAGEELVNSALAGAASLAGAKAGGLLGAEIGALAGPPGMLVGGIVGGLVGAYASSAAYDRHVAPLVEAGGRHLNNRLQATGALRRAQKLLDRAQSLLETGAWRQARTNVHQALSRLQAYRSDLLNFGYGREVLQVDGRASRLLAEIKRTRQRQQRQRQAAERRAVQETRALLESAQEQLRAGNLSAVEQLLAQSQARRPSLSRARRSELVRSMNRLRGQVRRARRRRQVQQQQQRHKPIVAAGPWRASNGPGGGTIRIVIDVNRQSFSATVKGAFSAPESVRVTFAGRFSGRFSGSSTRGTLRGGGSVTGRMQDPEGAVPLGTKPFQIQATLDGRVVAGTVTGHGGSYSFRVPVR